ncbi:MAG: hypothetical protein ACRDGQ_02295 [Candidatus Limnocylindrales bacterium]
MGPGNADKRKRIVVKTYGRGSLLGVLSLPLSYLMASRGMRGWQESAVRAMEDDVVEMARHGYRIARSDEYGMPIFGITYYKVTYELVDEPR